MLKLNDDFVLYDRKTEKAYTGMLTTADIKKLMKMESKETNREIFFADYVKDKTLVGMDDRGNGYYI